MRKLAILVSIIAAAMVPVAASAAMVDKVIPGNGLVGAHKHGPYTRLNVGAGPGISVLRDSVSVSFAGVSCPSGQFLGGFDAAGQPVCSASSGGGFAGLSCPAGMFVSGFDAAGQPLCSAPAGGGGTAVSVPVGTVIDWWRPDASWAVPDGYLICNGAVVADTGSPLYGTVLPDLTDRFVMGVTTTDAIGSAGGSAQHGHAVDLDHGHGTFGSLGAGAHSHTADPPMENTSTMGTHTHGVDPPALSVSANSDQQGRHQHMWLETYLSPGDGAMQFLSYMDGYWNLIGLWDNGMDNAGSGYYPLSPARTNEAYYTDFNGSHQHSVPLNHDHAAFDTWSSGGHWHSVDIAAVTTSTSSPHTHDVDPPGLGPHEVQTLPESGLPPYVGLLKLMRIR